MIPGDAAEQENDEKADRVDRARRIEAQPGTSTSCGPSWKNFTPVGIAISSCHEREETAAAPRRW